MKLDFSAIKEQIISMLEDQQRLFEPSDRVFEEVKDRIFNVILPETEQDFMAMGKDYVIKENECYISENLAGYKETSELPRWHEKMPIDHCQHISIRDDLFEYATAYKICQIIIDNLNDLAGNPVDENISPVVRSYDAKHYAITFIYVCLATDTDFRILEKKELVDLFNRMKKEPKEVKPQAPGIYSRFRDILKEKNDFNKVDTLEKYAGMNWKDILLELSDDPENLKAYLKRKKLI